jgi:hypothetical protein
MPRYCVTIRETHVYEIVVEADDLLRAGLEAYTLYDKEPKPEPDRISKQAIEDEDIALITEPAPPASPG